MLRLSTLGTNLRDPGLPGYDATDWHTLVFVDILLHFFVDSIKRSQTEKGLLIGSHLFVFWV